MPVLPPVLIILAVIALVLNIVFSHFIPAFDTNPRSRAFIALLLIILILIFWFVLPIHIG